jgi:hypothetical protein
MATAAKAPYASGMAGAARTSHQATVADLRALAEGRRFHEIIGGELVHKAPPSGEHGGAQAALAGSLFGPFNRRAGARCGCDPTGSARSSRRRTRATTR